MEKKQKRNPHASTGYWSIRVDLKESTKDDFIRYCRQRPDYKGKCLCVFEISKDVKKPHVHILLQDSRSYSAVRTHLLTNFPRDGIHHEYMLKCVYEDEIRNTELYLCKGDSRNDGLCILYHSDHYCEEIINSLHKIYWDINDTVTANSNINSVSTIPVADSNSVEVRPLVKKKSKKFLLQVCERIESLVDKNIVWNIKTHCKMWHEILITMHGRHFVPYNAHQIDKEMNALAAYFCPLEMIYESKKQLQEFHLPWSEWLG